MVSNLIREGSPQKSICGLPKPHFPDFPFRGSVGGRPVCKRKRPTELLIVELRHLEPFLEINPGIFRSDTSWPLIAINRDYPKDLPY